MDDWIYLQDVSNASHLGKKEDNRTQKCRLVGDMLEKPVRVP